MFMNAETIAALWFLPVVLFILIPLSVSFISFIHHVLKLVVENMEQAHRSAQEERESFLVLHGSA